MEKQSILKSSLLDLVFDGRNKDYGAYDLRKRYHSNLAKAMTATLAITTVVVLSSFFSRSKSDPVRRFQINDVVKLSEVDPVEPPPVIPPELPEPRPVASIDYTVPVVVPNEEVQPEDLPPDMTEIEVAKISNVKVEGDPFDIIAPPLETGGVVDAPRGKAEDSVFITVEIDAEFPGGNAGWKKYVQREIERNIDELQDDGRSGSVAVIFIVDKEGKVSDVKAASCEQSGIPNCLGAGTKLAEIAVNAIRKGPNWKPAQQNHQFVKAYRRQVVTFQLMEE